MRGFTLWVTLSAAIVMAGCGSDESSKSGSGADLSGKRATFVTFGSEEDQSIQKAWIDPVARDTGMQVQLDSPTDYAKLETQVKTGNVSWTVVMADPWWSQQQCGKLVEKRPADVNTSAIDKGFLNDDCGTPGDTFTWTLLYDKKKYAGNPPTGWKDFFDTKNFPGKRGVWGSYSVNGSIEAALLADGVPADALYPLDLDRAYRKLDTIRDDISFYDSIAQGEQQAASGTVSMLLAVNNSGLHLRNQGEDWGATLNQALETWDSYVVPKGADVAAATPLLQRLSSCDGQRAVIEAGLVSSVTVEDCDPPTPTGDEAEFIAGSDAPVVPVDQGYYAEEFETYDARWIAWVAG
jgi:putative spermidine/putrescine transport system substrate-binding protein